MCCIVRFARCELLHFHIPSLPWELYLSQTENICSCPWMAHIRTSVIFIARLIIVLFILICACVAVLIWRQKCSREGPGDELAFLYIIGVTYF